MENTPKTPEFSDYIKASLLNQYNLIGSGGIGVFALMSGTLPIVLPIWLGLELIIMWTLSTNQNFQRHVDASWEEQAQLRQEKLLNQVPEAYARRYLTLKTCYEEIRKSAGGPDLSNDMISVWQPEIEKLSYVLSSFLRLVHYLNNLEELLATTNKDALRVNINNIHRKMQNCSENLKFQYQRYVEILQQRLEKTEKANEICEAIRVQLNIIEEQFKLIQQQIFLVKNPQELTDQLDFLVQGINEIEDQGTMIMGLQVELAKLTPALPD